jgi:nucleoside-diphosphate-sugar epimerase
MINCLEADLTAVVNGTDPSIWEKLRGKKIFVTGGTGFFGRWILESLLAANTTFKLAMNILVLTRNPPNFKTKAPHLFDNGVIFYLKGDIKDFFFPDASYDFIIHAATEASQILNNENPLEMMDTIVSGTKRVLEFAKTSGCKKMLFISSGAIYGRQQVDVTHVTEGITNGPDILNPRNTYAESKRLGELMCSVYEEKFGIEIPVARCFAFVGPYLPLDAHFAIGNFILSTLKKQPITIKGDGSPERSYLYTSDLVIWLLTILVKGKGNRAYNVGSEHTISIESLAHLVKRISGEAIDIEILTKRNSYQVPERYVPSVQRIQKELGVLQTISLEESILKTINFHHYSN